MIKKIKIIVSSIVTLLPMVLGFVIWDKLPENIATSFGWNGEATGYSSKLFAVVGLPAILTFINLICILVTSADPRKNNINNAVFTIVLSVVPACSLICGACIYSNALGYSVNVGNIMSVFVGATICILGFVLPKCRQNYTVGFKLPWTLHDSENWDKTHKLAGKLWIIGGILMIAAGIFKITTLFVIVIFMVVSVPVVYSYLLYRNKRI